MAVTPDRTAEPLHNFDAFPCLKWRSDRYLRCVKLDSGDVGGGGSGGGSIDNRSAGMIAPRRRQSTSERRQGTGFLMKPRGTEKDRAGGGGGGEEEGIAAMREKLMCDLKEAANKLKEKFFGVEAAAEPGDEEADRHDDLASPAAGVEELAESRPWNLRKRKAACERSLRIEERKVTYLPATTRPVRRIPEKKERVKFAVALSRKEIESDFAEILGKRPPSRPKRRPRPIQKELDSLFPGLLLGEITEETYKVGGPKNGRTR